MYAKLLHWRLNVPILNDDLAPIVIAEVIVVPISQDLLILNPSVQDLGCIVSVVIGAEVENDSVLWVVNLL